MDILIGPFSASGIVFDLAELVAQEVDLVIRVPGEVESIRNDIRLVQSSMEIEEDIKEVGEDKVTWAGEARSFLSEVEDDVDIFQSKRARYLRRGALKKTLLWLPHLRDRVKLRNKVKKIRDQIQNLSNRRPIQLSNPPDLLAPEVQETYHSASTVVSSAMNKIILCLSQKLIINLQVRKIVEDTRSEFERLHGSILVDLQGEIFVDERARAWTEQVKDISSFTYATVSSFITKREPLMTMKNVSMFFLVSEDYSFGKIIKDIKSRVVSVYKRKWIFGIGYMETNSTSMVSVVSRLSPGYSPIRRNYPLPYATVIAIFRPTFLMLYGWASFFRIVIAMEFSVLEALTQRSTKQLEWIKGDLSLMEALFNDVDGIEENLDKRLAVWLDQMRQISEDPVMADLRDEQKIKTLKTRRIITMVSQINMKLSDMSERKWTYDIGKIEGRRYNGTSTNHRGLENLSSWRRPILLEPMEWLQNEVELMNAMIEDAQSHEGGLDVRLKVWLELMQDIAADANELLHNTDRIRCGFSNTMITREIDRINRHIQWVSRRKWLYDIGGIRGQRSTNASGSVSGSGWNRQMLVRPVCSIHYFLLMLYPGLFDSVLNLLPNVESIQRESSLLHALLEDVQLSESDNRVKAWSNQVRDVIDDIGVAIGNYDEHIKSKSNWSLQINEFIDRHRIANKIELILDKARDVMERRIKFAIELNQKKETSASSVNRYPSGAESYNFYKLKTTDRNVNILQAVMEQFLVQNEQCIVVSVVGNKGIGKTTLAQLIYNNDIVARHFLSHAWVSLSADCNTCENLSRIVEETLSRQLKLEDGDVIEADHGKQILVVLDEVRTTEIWDIVIKKLRSILDGRRIALIVTTSDVAVAVHADPKSTHKLQLLNDDDSWALFTQPLIEVPEGLKCGGFPILGSSTENLGQGAWTTAQEVVKGLPLSLKRCLLYLIQFPTDFEIPLRRLTLLWLAEGILRQWWDEEGFESPESVAERYLTELADRCLVQVTKRNLHGEVLKCRLPHVLRGLLSSGYEKAESKDLKSSLSSTNIRHLVHFERKKDGTSGPFHSCITDLSASGISEYQSVIAFHSFDNREGNQSGVDLGKFLDRCISLRTFLLMRVLDLERVFRPVLPKALGELVLLKYLGLRWTYLESLPSFMSKMLNLQTLDLKHTSISRLPDSIWKMGQLRHLFLDEYYHCRFVRRPSRYSLPHLQTLWNVFIDEDSPVQGGLDSSIKLTRLGVECRLMSHQEGKMASKLKAVANWVQNLKDLKSLRLKSFDKCGKPWNIPLKTLSGQTKLCSLYLLGWVQKDLVISGLPLSLTELTLSGSGLEDDPMQLLKTLTNLRSLSLFSDSFVGKQMLCSEGFAQLQFLKIWKLENLEEWKVESGALPNLVDLEIRSCERLKTFPDELQNSKTLQKINFSDMPKEWDKIRETFFARRGGNAKDKVTNTPEVQEEADPVPHQNLSGLVVTEGIVGGFSAPEKVVDDQVVEIRSRKLVIGGNLPRGGPVKDLQARNRPRTDEAQPFMPEEMAPEVPNEAFDPNEPTLQENVKALMVMVANIGEDLRKNVADLKKDVVSLNEKVDVLNKEVTELRQGTGSSVQSVELEIVEFPMEPTPDQCWWHYFMTRVDKAKAWATEDTRNQYNQILLVKVEGGYHLSCAAAFQLQYPEWITCATLDCMSRILHKEEREPGTPDRKICYLPSFYDRYNLDLVGAEYFGEWKQLGMISLPLNINECHWILLVVSLDNKAVYILDSGMQFIVRDVIAKVDYLHRSLVARFKDDYTQDVRDWPVKQMWPKIVRQTNGNDCGVYLCFFMKHLRKLVPTVSVSYRVNERWLRIWLAHYIGSNIFNELHQNMHEEVIKFRDHYSNRSPYLHRYSYVPSVKENLLQLQEQRVETFQPHYLLAANEETMAAKCEVARTLIRL